ncbi:DinB family protein [Paenibacillus sp. MMS20-IR301]|uniref:DinB family protein n=1 Tax=Paenibacillus sp. MMS20-IR301 TaxID=2895946 RepID=UPI0028F15E45|nr:DinB family protein [Paenibacillus sp. MMS20-IR301]WNS46499.1 DinB family protein [Paenibacillus sp. MMS20-IR301]
MAATTKEQLVLEFESFIPYIQSLEPLDERIWETPLADGKWNLKALLCHIMKWDKYFYEEAFAKVKAGQPLTAKHLNFNEFNARAAEYAQTVPRQEIIRQFIHYRSRLISDMTGISDEAFVQTYPDGDGKKFSYRGHLRGFLPHDRHHKKQIGQFIQAVHSA